MHNRREFLRTSALAGAGLGIGAPDATLRRPVARRAEGPVVISSANGLRAVQKAYDMMVAGEDALTATIAGVNIVEEDPDDITVGYGGIPNEDGVVQLDSCVMHGPTCRSGAVAALEGIKNPSKVARLVLERTDHCLLVGQGAQRFAKMHGFKIEDLVTDRAREIWVQWKETATNKDDYLPPHSPEDKDIGSLMTEIKRSYGTIHCSGIDLEGNISGVTTTSGLFFKIPGRVGDSPIAGAGIYVDNEVGAAGSTGRGEANIENLASFLIVERMRAGDGPEEACLYACRRIVSHTKLGRLLNDAGEPNFNVRFYAVNKAGDVGGAEIRGGEGKMAMADAEGARLIDVAYLFKSS